MTESFSDYGIEVPAGASAQIAISCPQCSQQRRKKNAKCLSVNVDKGVWHCNHCDWSGGLKEQKNKRPAKEREYRRPEPSPAVKLSEAGVSWFAQRAISREALTRNKIETVRAYFPQIEDTADAIVFPYFRAGQLVNRKYRSLENKHFRLETGCELVLYGLDDIIAGEDLIWVEGEADKLALETAGFCNVVSVPNGAPPPNAKSYESKFSFLDSAREQLNKVKRHIIAVDSDAPGAFLEVELARRLGTEKCWRVKWPQGSKDANEVLIKHGADEVRWYIKNPEAFPIEGAFGAADRRDDLRRLYQYGFERGQRTGWPTLDKYYTVRAGEFTAVTGVPSSGKSNFIDALIVNLARMHDWRFAVFSPENLPLEQHMSMILEKYVGRPFHEGYNQRMTEIDLELAIGWAEEHFTWIMPGNENDWTLERILETASQLCLRYGIRGLVIDPWNELESLRPRDISETEYISQSLKRIKVFARAKAIHVWVVIHPAKLMRDKDGKYPVPTLYDCAGSAHWRNKADNGITVWRDLSQEDTSAVDIYIQKIRFRQIGRRGMAKLYYEPQCATYAESSKPAAAAAGT